MATKKLTNNGNGNLLETRITLGLDIGYGVSKAIVGDLSIVFPSVWGYARRIKFKADEIAQKYPGDQLTDDEGSWFVGDLALSQLRAGEQRTLRGRTADEKALGNPARARLAKVAIGKLFPGVVSGDVVHVRIATGLPVDHMGGADELKEALLGQHLIQTDTSKFIANITDVMVMPQPYGTIYRNMLTERGDVNDCHNYDRTGVVDVGTYTVDLTLDDDGEYIDSFSGSIEAGMFTVQERVASLYESEFGSKLGYKDIESIIRTGCFRFQGQPVNFQRELEEAFEPLRLATLNLMGNLWGNAGTIDVIYVAGGGASVVIDAIRAAYPQAQLVQDSQLANARGYLNYANFALR